MYEEYIKQLHTEAKLRNLADSSIKTYTDFILRFLEYTGKEPQDITPQDVREFLLFRQETIAATTLNHYNSAILFLEEINHILDCVDDVKPHTTKVACFQ